MKAPLTPADPWPVAWRWLDFELPVHRDALAYDAELQSGLDEHILQLIRSADPARARAMRDISLGLAQAQTELKPRVFWQICASYFEALSLNLCPADARCKRMLSRILLQYRALARGQTDVSRQLPCELLMLMAQAGAEAAAQSALVGAVSRAYDLAGIQARSAAELRQETSQDRAKVIGNLRIGIAEFNAYLNEADEWSRCLHVELSEWALELHRPVSQGTLGWAASLAQSSAGVGLAGIASLAQALEKALRHVQPHVPGLPEHASLFLEAAEDVRRLLHQFAAGFLKEPAPRLLQALAEVAQFEMGDSAAALAEFENIDAAEQFTEEALPLLQQLGGALRQWRARPDNVSARNEALRILHALQDSSQQAGVSSLHRTSRLLESAIERLGKQPLQADQLDPLFSRFDTLKVEFEHFKAS